MIQYKIVLSKQAQKDLNAIPDPFKSNIQSKLLSLENGLSNEVQRLRKFEYDYRLRVNDYRVLFNMEEENLIIIHRIKHRKEAYQ